MSAKALSFVTKMSTDIVLVKEIEKLEQERSVFCPGLFREERDR